MIAAYLIDPARRTYELAELAADEGIAVRRAEPTRARPTRASSRWRRRGRGAGPGPRRRRAARLGAGRAPAAEARGLRPRARARRGRDAADRGAGRDGAGGRDARLRRRLAAISGELSGAGRVPAGGDLGAGRARVHDRLAAAARRGALRRARAEQEAARQDRLLDRRPRPLPDPRRARDRPQGRALARDHEAEEHLPRLAAELHRSRGRPHPHHLQPGARRDRAALEHRPEPAEHPDPLRRRPARSAAASSPPRDARSSPATTTRSSCGSSPTSPATRPCAQIFASGEDVHCCDRRGDHRRRSRGDLTGRALEGEDGQLRDRLRALRVRARRAALDLARGGRGLHRPLLRALPGGQAVHRRDDRAGRARRAR